MNVDMKPAGTFATPYGVEVPVLKPEMLIPGQDPDAFYFPASSAAICAGIHDLKERERFVTDTERTGDIPFDRAATYGGFPKLLRLPLPRPSHVVDRDVPTDALANDQGVSCREVVDHWVDQVTLHVRWSDRAECLLGRSVRQMDAIKAPPFVVGFSLSLIVTSVMENLGEEEVDCLEAAAFYALTAHEEWRKVGTDWLHPIRDTWWRDWIKARQGYRRVAKIMSAVYDDLPPWLYGRGL